MVTIYDIAKKANVSPMTVSRVLNNTGRISEATRARVKKIMEEYNYVPNSMARSLVKQETKIFSLLITDITNPFYTTLARGAEDAAKRYGYKVMFSNSDEDLDKESDYLEAILSTKVDGVLFAPSGDRSLEHLQMLRKHNIPFVLLDREVPGIEFDAVVGDSKEGAKNLVHHLIGLGHRNIAFINGSLEVSTARLRQEGYVEALILNGIAVNNEWVMEAGYKQFDSDACVDRLLANEERPTAVFAANNLIAVRVIRSLRKRGLLVPDDMSVVCFDDLDPDMVVDPFLTVAAQPAYDFGSIGIGLLMERIQGIAGKEWRKVILPSKLIIRDSAQTPK